MSFQTSASSPAFSLTADLDELRSRILYWLCLAAMGLAWLWIAVVGVPGAELPAPERYAPPALILMGAGLCLACRRSPLPVRSILLLAGLLGAFLGGYALSSSPNWLYYQLLVIHLAAILFGPRVLGLMTLALTAAIALLYGQSALGSSAVSILSFLGLMWSTALAAWLAQRNLFTALDWAFESQAAAWRSTEDARARRAELRRALDSLHLTHGILMRTMEELEAARQEAESARQAKSRFVANISHELRTPLNVITGFAEMLCTSPGTYGDFHWPDELAQDLNTIWRNAEHLLNMVDDILDLAQIEAERLPIVRQPTDIARLIVDTLDTVRRMLADSQLELRLALPEEMIVLNIDPTRIRQVLLNLVSNAVRHTSSGYIEVRACRRQGEVLVSVEDSGEGIPSDKLEVIFEAFQRLDTSVQYGDRGVGLGLAIAKHFISLHGGAIWAESEPGTGSIFHFTLPLPESAYSAGPAVLQRTAHRIVPPREGKRQVLVLSDDELVVRQVERHMAEQFTLSVAPSMAAARTMVREEHPDLVLVTTDAPDGLADTLDRARALAEMVRPYDVPILVGGVPTERRAGAALQVSDLLIKPITARQLTSAVESICAHPRRVLIVEDEPDMLHLLERVMKERWDEAEVLLAVTGGEALALLDRRPNLILLDLLLPDMNGIQVLSALRARSGGAATPVIVITARGPAEATVEGYQGRLHVLRNSPLTTGELTRCAAALAETLHARYASEGAPVPGTRGSGHGSPA
ncbi:MAG: response regulator [Anaerolineae bacterium]|nr:response regulator [Anaerolineae bacterium]